MSNGPIFGIEQIAPLTEEMMDRLAKMQPQFLAVPVPCASHDAVVVAAVAAERERCAKIAEDHEPGEYDDIAGIEIASKIRSGK